MTTTKSRFYHKDGTTSDEWDNSKILHRTDGPAAEWTNGDKDWYVDGKRHRIDGPAVEWTNGDKDWYVDDKRHRVGGPAVEWADGTKWWYVDSRLHRIDGPAVEYASGDKYWYVDGEKYAERQFNNLIKEINEMNLAMKLTDPRQWVRELGEKEVNDYY